LFVELYTATRTAIRVDWHNFPHYNTKRPWIIARLVGLDKSLPGFSNETLTLGK
jgi:hypothetical protein